MDKLSISQFLSETKGLKLKAVTQYKKILSKHFAGVKQEVLQYKRADGTDLTARLLPPNHTDEHQLLPLIMWAYPMEYKDKQNRRSKIQLPDTNLFILWGSPIY